MLRVYVWGNPGDEITQRCRNLILEEGFILSFDLEYSDLAIAPLLTKKLTREKLQAPQLGTLIFHPSLLPRHRGRDAIKWSFRLCEPYSGATWFWADEGYDTGDICEMEVLAIQDGESPRQFYQRSVIPAGVRMLGYILQDLRHGIFRRRPQQEQHASYEPPIPKHLPMS